MSLFETVLDKNEQMIDRIQAAEYLGVTPHTLQQWAHKKQHLPYYKVGRLAKYKLSDLQDFINNSKQEINQSKGVNLKSRQLYEVGTDKRESYEQMEFSFNNQEYKRK